MGETRFWGRGAVAALTFAVAACAAAAPEELGRIEFAASGAAQARPWFERGVAALHSFWYDEAAESFRRAREIDPAFVMAYWGEAMTQNHPVWDQVDLAGGRAALAALAPTAAGRAEAAPTERERAYLDAVALLFPDEEAPEEGSDAAKAARDRRYEEAMARLAERFPDDPEARIFHALAVEGVVYGGVDEPLRFPLLMQAAASLEELFDEHPQHPGVLHYLIHAYDDPVHAPLGLRAARRYAQVAPAAHHALHMPSHIFVQLGRWGEAAASNEDAWAASVAWVDRRGLSPEQRDFHSLSWLIYAYLQDGRLEKARETLEIARAADAESDGMRSEHTRWEMEARYRIETGAASPPELLDEEAAGPGMALAVALAAYRERDAATLRRAAAAVEKGEPKDGSAAAVQELEIEALLALAEDRQEDGLGLLERAVAAEEALGPPSGPPEVLKPAHELYADVLLALGRRAEAAGQYAVSLRRTPGRALSLRGAARAAAAPEVE